MKFPIIATLTLCLASQAVASSLNGRAGAMPAIYDGQLFTINLMEKPDNAAESLLDHNQSINTIYESDALIGPDNTPFIAVLDAIQGDGFNPLWLEVEIEFTAGHPPRQLQSDDDIDRK